MSEIAQAIVEDLTQKPAAPKPDIPPTEPPPIAAEAKPEPKEDENLTARFTALSKKEKMIVDREKAIKAREESIKQYDLTRESVMKSPTQALASLGMTFEEFAKAMIAEGEGQPLQPTVDDKVKALEERLKAKEDAEKTALAAEEQRKIDESISSYKANLKKHLDGQGEKYELIQSQDAHETVFDVIESYFHETGQMLDADKAAEQVENYLFEEGQKILKAKKFAPKEPTKEKEQFPKVTTVNPVSPTLTNKSTAPAITPPAPTHMSAEESLKRAASLLRWT